MSSNTERPKTHELKTWPEYFTEVLIGKKNFELRFNDRDFKAGDMLLLKEYDNDKKEYTGREVLRKIDYVLKDGHKFGLHPDQVILSLSTPSLPSSVEENKKKNPAALVSMLEDVVTVLDLSDSIMASTI